MKIFWIWMLIVVALAPAADARSLPMEAQNRIHIGGGWTPGSSHISMGFDSRMTQVLFIDVGTFLSLGEPGKVSESDPYVLRQGLFVDPGFRIPHRNKGDLYWDIIVRGGFGPVWLADQQSNYEVRITPSFDGGSDFMLRYGNVGFRVEGRIWYAKPFSEYEQQEVVTIRPQVGGSLLYTF